MAFVRRLTVGAAVLSLALSLNFFLFILIPALHDLFGVNIRKKDSAGNRKIVAELFKPKPKPKPQKSRRVRRMQSASSGKGQSRSMKFDFTPDLSVEGGDGVAMESQKLSAMVFNEGETDESATPVSTAPIPYPTKARELGVEGTLRIEFVVGPDGRVASIKVLESPHPVISQAARKAIEKWRFRPAVKDGIPVKQRLRQEVEFALE